jgi:hypothetical protein
LYPLRPTLPTRSYRAYRFSEAHKIAGLVMIRQMRRGTRGGYKKSSNCDFLMQ